MEKRLIVFLLSAWLLLFAWQRFIVPPPPDEAAEPEVPAVPDDPSRPDAPAPAFIPPVDPGDPAVTRPAREVVVRSPLYEYRLSTRGAGFTGAELLRFESYVQRGEAVQLVPQGAVPVLSHRLVVGRDTLDLSRLTFDASEDRVELAEGDAPRTLRFTSGGPVPVEITYLFRPDNYLVDVDGRISGIPEGAELLTELGTGLAPHDAADHGSERELSAVGWDTNRIQRVHLRKVRDRDSIPGPLVWAGIKDRYFVVALINEAPAGFRRLLVEARAPETYTDADGKERASPRARAEVSAPLAADGSFRYEAYLGPQEHGRLAVVGHQLQEVNPYGYRWLRPVVRPIAGAILWVLNQLHDTLGIAYGWVLIIFGFLMRIVLWPLNARAMRSQMKNMAVQPLLQKRMKEINTRFKNDPKGQQEAIMEMYKELGVNPFSMMSGCLPMLIPMPVLITLFFVFQSAIEFRGTSFAWLPDLSLRDPYYLLPIFLVVSMFGLQWVSTKMSGMEQNPQMKMMMYMMPVMMGIIFWIMPAGLNLYYAATNVASFPQQILIARERKRHTEAQKVEDEAKERAAKAAARSTGGGGAPRAKRTRRKG
jgi:YidC/Oxa1 family membrane protein insertase